ncbi:MAG: hypothetical protein AN487_24280, partial [Anabaena sp. CRKS33]
VEHRRVRVDGHVVLHRGVALGAADEPALGVAGERERPERDALVDGAAGPDHGGLADHHARAVIDEETGPDRGAGMEVDPGRA